MTFRLADAIPKVVLQDWLVELAALECSTARAVELDSRVERYLDRGEGECPLQDPHICRGVEKALLCFDGDHYLLHAWVIMPNHVHAALTPQPDYLLRDIVESWKSYTARRINNALGRDGRLWQRSFFDRAIRNEEHFKEVVWYIHQNPVRQGLCGEACDFRWSSARRRATFAACLEGR